MSQRYKLQPDQDLQCYFERPSAIAAMSQASSTGFVVSGTWRQQFDWAVIEWNRDNVFEHALHRNLPDGDLSGIVLSYEETRENAIPIDSNLFPTVDWPFLRIWCNGAEGEEFHKVKLFDYATAVEGEYTAAHATFTLDGTLTVGDYVGLTWLDEQYNHLVATGDTLASIASSLAATINALSPTVEAEASDTEITLHYVGVDGTIADSITGLNGNRVGAYGFVSGARTETWSPASQKFHDGTSPTKWRIDLDFSDLHDIDDALVPMTDVRKMRWTFAADQQPGTYERSEFQVEISSWEVTGTGLTYLVAGPGSRRIENDSPLISSSGTWDTGYGNFSGGSIQSTTAPSSTAVCTYHSPTAHTLYLGTRYSQNAPDITVAVDGGSPVAHHLTIPDDDVLCRRLIGTMAAGSHVITIAHAGTSGETFYFDYLELAQPTADLALLPLSNTLSLATDWDTDHSIALPAERTAWSVYATGFGGRVNHYVGALWFYELERHEHQYASCTVTFTGTPAFSEFTTISINIVDFPPTSATVYSHLNLIGDTAETIAKAFELSINNGSTAIWAEASEGVLTIWARKMGEVGNDLTCEVTPDSGTFHGTSTEFSGGDDGYWRTDVLATPRINRAARDWTRSLIQKLDSYGLETVSAFSTELQHGDPSPEAGIAQRYPNGDPVLLNTPALQTNFSNTSLNYWKQVHMDMAQIMDEAGVTPFLQFGEVQWWYFPYGGGMPFYDDDTKARFEAEFGFPIRLITSGNVDPAPFPEEAAFLPNMIGEFTDAIIAFVRDTYPECLFEVLYPTDVNEGAINRVINLPDQWNTSTLDSFKTESFLYMLGRNMNNTDLTIRFGALRGFPKDRHSHLVGISDVRSPWQKEAALAVGAGLKSVVLFALDQLCLISYPLPLPTHFSRSVKMG